MYTLLVTGAAAEQHHGVFRIDGSRFLEYTDEAIVGQLRPLSAEAVDCLRSWPCILMEEGRADEIVRIGRITDASRSAREVSLVFEPLSLPMTLPLTNDDIWKLRSALDIGDFEFGRNHVAVKDRDALSILDGAGYDIGNASRAQFEERPLPAPARADLLRARDVISDWGHSEIDDLLLDIGSSDLGMIRGQGSPRDRANAILRFALANPEAKTAENSLLSAYLVRRTLNTSIQPVLSELVTVPSESPESRSSPSASRASSRSPNRVFVVHGKNETVRTSVVNHLRELGLEPIVLHDQPNMGRHLLTKFIQEAKLVTFAVVVMTDDDIGSVRDGALAPRARQNVILELGYFLAHLGQPRVCALITAGLETPSDFDGIVYIRMDSEGGWRHELTRELRAAEMPLLPGAGVSTA